eukprot:s832_g29.t1
MQPLEPFGLACLDFQRSLCCYGGLTTCFDERCCTPRHTLVGPEAFIGFIAHKDTSFPDSLVELRRISRQGHGGRAAHRVVWTRRLLLRSLHDLLNITDAGVPKNIEMAYFFLMQYYVTLEALRRKLTSNFRRVLVRKEAEIWKHFSQVVRQQWGYVDFCRCVEAAEFYSYVRQAVWHSQIPSRNFAAQLLNRSRGGRFTTDGSICRNMELQMAMPPSVVGQALYASQCLPGDVAQFLTHGQECLLEHEFEKFLHIQRSLLFLATLVMDCLDTEFWGFSPRDVAVELGKAVWQVAKRETAMIPMTKSFLGQFVWSPHRGVENEKMDVDFDSPWYGPWQGQPWHVNCGPHSVTGPAEVTPIQGLGKSRESYLGPQYFGPLCTDSGRFWLSIGFRQVHTALHERTLLIFPVTYSDWSNPWHHLHWWIPALDLKKRLQLEAKDVDIALAFPYPDADWGITAKQSADNTTEAFTRSEPVHWSFLQHIWPKGANRIRAWKPKGLHEDVLRWLSDRPARQLKDYYGQSYAKIILGLRSLRFQVFKSGFDCEEMRDVANWIRQTPQYTALGPDKFPEELAVLQRPLASGRAILNLQETTSMLADFAAWFSPLKVTVIEKIQGLPWVKQFRRFQAVRVLVGVHGAGLSWLWSMPRGAAVVEFRPKGSPAFILQCSERWDEDGHETYGGLARLALIHHICLRQEPVKGEAVKDLDFENWDRNANVTLDLGRLNLVIQGDPSVKPPGRLAKVIEMMADSSPRGACGHHHDPVAFIQARVLRCPSCSCETF